MTERREILIAEAAIRDKVRELGGHIARDYEGKDLVLVGVLKGAVVFLSDLMRCIPYPVAIDFVHASSYGMGTVSSREIRIRKDIDADVRGRHVLLVDTIIDTGETLKRLFGLFSEKGAAGVRAVVLLDKRSRRTAEVPLSYIGFEIPDRFVVGYGVDCGEQYRNLPHIAVIEQE